MIHFYMYSGSYFILRLLTSQVNLRMHLYAERLPFSTAAIAYRKFLTCISFFNNLETDKFEKMKIFFILISYNHISDGLLSIFIEMQ